MIGLYGLLGGSGRLGGVGVASWVLCCRLGARSGYRLEVGRCGWRYRRGPDRRVFEIRDREL